MDINKDKFLLKGCSFLQGIRWGYHAYNTSSRTNTKLYKQTQEV